MKTKHVRDEQIQTYVFDLNNCENPVIEHINSCTDCKGLANDYQYLSEDIKALPEPGLDFNLTEKVLKKILQAKQKYTQDYTRIGALFVLGSGIVAIVLHLVKSGNISLIETENFNTFFIAFVGLFIAVLWSLDMLKTFHKKMISINYV